MGMPTERHSLLRSPPGEHPVGGPVGALQAPQPTTGLETGSPYQLLGCSPRCRSDTSLIYPPTYSGRRFPQQTPKWRFSPWPTGHLYGKSRLPYKAINPFPYKKSAGTSPKKFSCKIPSPQSTNRHKKPPAGRIPRWFVKRLRPQPGSHQLAKFPPRPSP